MDSTIEVMVNQYYGGFEFSNEFACIAKEWAFKNVTLLCTQLRANNPVMIRIVREIGLRASRDSSEIVVKHIPAVLENCYSIDEIDGAETVILHPNTFKVDQAKRILLEKQLSKTKRLESISDVLYREIQDVVD